ncbi:STAS domain-containing protein [Dactylosporangium sp. CS-033363]|uniref:STAS domain-containing protein n=1 Tax=Dactylosporangium sp. CS-033363 TaxID=3239935 RepID=UPI003D936737
MQLSIGTVRFDAAGLTVVTAAGELGRATRPRVLAAVRKCFADGPGAVVLDLGAARLADPAGHVCVLVLQQEAGRAGVPFAVVGDRGELARRLRVLCPTLRRYRTLADARAAVLAGDLVPRWVYRREPAGRRLRACVRELVQQTCVQWDLEALVDPALLVADHLVSVVRDCAAPAVEITIDDRPWHWMLRLNAGCRRTPAVAVPSDRASRPLPVRGVRIVVSRGAGGCTVWAALNKRTVAVSRRPGRP